MVQEKIKRFWKSGLIRSLLRGISLAVSGMIMLILAGCSDEIPEAPDIKMIQSDKEVHSSGENDSSNENNSPTAESIEQILSDLYDEAVKTNTLGSLDMTRRMVARLGENGYVAVDSGNQVDMTQAEQALAFCKAADEEETAGLTIIVIMETGLRK